jgi:hypothetical protein
MTGRGMSNRKIKQPSYESHVVGHLDNLWGEWFDGLTLPHTGDGTTLFGQVGGRPGSAARTPGESP